MKIKKNILIDGNNLLYRTHAIFVKDKTPEELFYNKSGYPTSFIYGFFSILSDWVQSMSDPSSMILFLDGSSKRRLIIDPDYKRKEFKERPGRANNAIKLSDGFEAQSELDVIVHLMELMGADTYRDKDEEADDLIASFVQQNSSDISIIISSDKDFYQLLSEEGRVVLYRPGIKGNRFFDLERAEEDLFNRFKIKIKPYHIRMFKTLTGDPSDGITGIPRIRKKVIASLCACDDIESFYNSGFPGFSKLEVINTLNFRSKIERNYELIKLNDKINIEAVVHRARPDFDVALSVLRQDLNINTIFPETFNFSNQSGFKIIAPISDIIPDWLLDI